MALKPIFSACFTIFVVTLFFLTGCRQSASKSETNPNVRIEVTVQPSPPAVGNAVLVVYVTDLQDQAIEGVAVHVRGDMTHGGMQPVFGETDSSANGTYLIPFQWTMGGDWILTITADLADGSQAESQFQFTLEN